MATKLCPVCGKEYTGGWVASQNTAGLMICPECGTRENLERLGVRQEGRDHIIGLIRSSDAVRKVKRVVPNSIFEGWACSTVAVGTALGVTDAAGIREAEGLEADGYLSLKNMNRFVRDYLPVERRVDFRRGNRPSLIEFLRTNDHRAIICVLGHYLYADQNVYYSFLKNGEDPVVTVWYLS